MSPRVKPREETARYTYKVKLQLTSKKAWHHHLAAVNIMKESKYAKPGQTTVAWQTLVVRHWLLDGLQATRYRLFWGA